MAVRLPDLTKHGIASYCALSILGDDQLGRGSSVMGVDFLMLVRGLVAIYAYSGGE